MRHRSIFTFTALLGIAAASLPLSAETRAAEASQVHICRINANQIWGAIVTFDDRKEVMRSEIRPEENVWLINDRAVPIEATTDNNEDGEPMYTVSIHKFVPAFVLSELARRGMTFPPEGEQVIIAQVMTRYGSTLQGRERYATMVPGKHMLIFADREPYTGEAGRVAVVDCEEE
ncbi:hypothetical protein [Shinella kummerowiae]|uniref:hypothetical protein n=1 Tax=Shinella kummerowiae TaxID=417745 RepID=UPI0021B6638C|nr:hypothetical protein [Shinella kummerowiae]MCT7663538.1 hypothetical protein [Shinella kummerowiae]